jgi:hypothetical protein
LRLRVVGSSALPNLDVIARFLQSGLNSKVQEAVEVVIALMDLVTGAQQVGGGAASRAPKDIL